MEARLMKNFRHIQKQNTSMHRAILHIFQGLFNNIPAGDPNPWMHPEHFADFLNWPGDRPHFAGGTGTMSKEKLRTLVLVHLQEMLKTWVLSQIL